MRETDEFMPMSMTEFENTPSSVGPAPLTRALKALKPGQAVTVSHEGLGCYHEGYGRPATQCSVYKIREIYQKRTGYRYKFKHISNGLLAVACLEGE